MNDQELEEHRARMQALMREAINPLLERLDAAEKSLEAARTADGAQDAERLVEARARFRASLVAEIVAGQQASNTFSWNMCAGEIREAAQIVDLILTECGVT